MTLSELSDGAQEKVRILVVHELTKGNVVNVPIIVQTALQYLVDLNVLIHSTHFESSEFDKSPELLEESRRKAEGLVGVAQPQRHEGATPNVDSLAYSAGGSLLVTTDGPLTMAVGAGVQFTQDRLRAQATTIGQALPVDTDLSGSSLGASLRSSIDPARLSESPGSQAARRAIEMSQAIAALGSPLPVGEAAQSLNRYMDNAYVGSTNPARDVVVNTTGTAQFAQPEETSEVDHTEPYQELPEGIRDRVAALFSDMRTAGMETIELDIHGGGDEGSVEETYYTPNTATTPPTWTELGQRADELYWDLCSMVGNSGWWNNEGGGGNITYDATDNTINWNHWDYVQERDETSYLYRI
jgi:hypothetical protein